MFLRDVIDYRWRRNQRSVFEIFEIFEIDERWKKV